MNDIQIEICVNSVLSAVNARTGGAQRIELCQDLGGGGTTPSAAAIDYCVRDLGLRTHVLIRPRTGDFLYSSDEVEVMLRDIAFAKKLKAHAVVVGFLTPDRQVDTELTRRAVAAAAPLEVTFHRAIDESADPLESLEQIIACGCHRILTSGGAPTAMEGADMLRRMKEAARGRIGIIAAAGIVPANARTIVERSGVDEVHGSCKHTIGDITCTDAEEVRELIRQLNPRG